MTDLRGAVRLALQGNKGVRGQRQGASLQLSVEPLLRSLRNWMVMQGENPSLLGMLRCPHAVSHAPLCKTERGAGRPNMLLLLMIDLTMFDNILSFTKGTRKAGEVLTMTVTW